LKSILPITPLILPLFYPLPTFFPILIPALKTIKLPSIKLTIPLASTLSITQELVHNFALSIIRTIAKRNRQNKKNLSGIQVRGQAIKSDQQIECSICLDPIVDDNKRKNNDNPLESFCTACSTPLHRSCLIQWWNSVQATQSSPRRREGFDRATILTTFPPLPPVAHAALLAIIEDYDILGASAVIEFGQNGIRMNGQRGPPRRNAMQPWNLGIMSKIFFADLSESRGVEEAGEGVTIYVSETYSKNREQDSQRWHEDFKSLDALHWHRNDAKSMIGTIMTTDDPEIAKLISKSPGKFFVNSCSRWSITHKLNRSFFVSLHSGPTCPLCRSSLELSVVLVTPSRQPSLVGSFFKGWEFNVKSVLDSVCLQLALGGVVYLSRAT
jgi:hypothetical protein